MAFYSRRGNWGYNPYKRWRSGGRKAVGNAKASKQTRDSMNITVKCNQAFIAKYDKETEKGVAVINCYEVLRNNAQFASFSKLYDQIKLNNVKVTLNVVDATIEATQLQAVKTINVITAWDRTGISQDNVSFFDANSNLVPKDRYDGVSAGSYNFVIGKGIVNATGVDKSILNSFQRWSKKPYIFASTVEEKGCYLSTSNFKEFTDGSNFAAGGAQFRVGSLYNESKISDFFNSYNPCVPFESPSCKWKPTLLVGVFKTGVSNSIVNNNDVSIVDNYQSCGNVVFNAEFTMDITFRNLKASL